MSQIDLKYKRQQKIEEVDALLGTAKKENRDFTAEENQKCEQLHREIKHLSLKIDALDAEEHNFLLGLAAQHDGPEAVEAQRQANFDRGIGLSHPRAGLSPRGSSKQRMASTRQPLGDPRI